MRFWIVLAGVHAFVVSWVAVFLIGINETAHWECDGPCFNKWDEVVYIAFAVGGLSAIVAGYFTWRFISNRSGARTSE